VSSSPPSPAPGPVLDHSVLSVSDWDCSNAFYARVLGADVLRHGAGYVYRLGDQQLNLHGPGVDGDPNARIPVAPGGSDLCFAWPGSAATAEAHLRAFGVRLEVGPVDRFGARGPGRSVYFRDPDGSLLELISYPGG
jgi:catechol 2,3-dioxygenase-like lactoylglutathione lyase family enzyme